MKSITESTKKKLLISSDKGTYMMTEICPVCGSYTPDGDLCICCQKEYNLYKPKVHYEEY